MALILRYFTEFVYNVALKQYYGGSIMKSNKIILAEIRHGRSSAVCQMCLRHRGQNSWAHARARSVCRLPYVAPADGA